MSGLTVLCDLDAIVADLLGTWLSEYNVKHGRALQVCDITKWEMHECAPDGHRVYDILQRDGLFRGLHPLGGALDGLAALHGAGHEVVILTASAKRPETAADKLGWIREHLPWLTRKDVLIGHKKHLVRGHVLIDDSPENIRSYRAAWPDAKIVTIDYPYNRDAPVNFRAMDYSNTLRAWGQIVAYINNLTLGAPSPPEKQPSASDKSGA